MRPPRALAALLLAPALAGCLAAPQMVEPTALPAPQEVLAKLGQVLEARAPEEEATVTFGTSTSATPAEDLVSTFLFDLSAGEPSQRAVFASPTARERAVLMGNPALHLNVSVDQPGGYLGVGLYDMSPTRELSLVTRGYVNLATRDSRDATQDVPTGTPIPLTVPMYALAHVVEPGHRLALTLEGNGEGAYPHLLYAPTWTLHIEPGRPMGLDLPVLEGALPADVPKGSPDDGAAAGPMQP
jgi:hypothetical protein